MPIAVDILVIDSVDGRRLASASTQYATINSLYGLEAAEAIGLRELTLGIWDCQPGLPIGPTGFELTGVQGTIKLRSTLEEVSVKVQIQSIAKLLPVYKIRTDCMSPCHIAPWPAERIMLVEQVVLAIEIHQSVRIIVPAAF